MYCIVILHIITLAALVEMAYTIVIHDMQVTTGYGLYEVTKKRQREWVIPMIIKIQEDYPLVNVDSLLWKITMSNR